MGCWCETDGVTQLPINHGDKVRLFIIINNGYDDIDGGGQCYSNDIWSPLCPPIQGTYDDYGGVENIKNDEYAKNLLKVLKDKMLPVEDKYDNEEKTSVNDMSLEQALRWIERGRAKSTGYKGKPVVIGQMMVLEEVYQAMINFDPIEAYHNWSEKSYFYMPTSEMLKKELTDWYVEKLASYATFTELSKKAKSTDEKLSNIADMMLELSDGRLFSDYKDHAMKTFKNLLVAEIKKGTDVSSKKVQKIFKSSLDMTMFSRAMSHARKAWAPQSGKGSQNNELQIYKLLADATNSIVTAREKEDLEDGGEPLDENGYSSYMLEHNKEVLSKGTNGTQKV